jgi:hypothetical protein
MTSVNTNVGPSFDPTDPRDEVDGRNRSTERHRVQERMPTVGN